MRAAQLWEGAAVNTHSDEFNIALINTLTGCLVYFCPCYVFGKTAEAVGDNCCLCGCAYMLYPFNFFARLHVRERIRQKKDLKVASYTSFMLIRVAS